MPIQWNALQPAPNAFGNYLQGQQAGDEIRRERAKQNAFAKFSTDPKGAVADLYGADPAAAITLRGVMRDDEKQQGYDDAAATYAAGDPAAARMKAITSRNPELVQTFAGLDKEHRELVKEQSGLIASALYPLQKLTDPNQRVAAWTQQKATLASRGVPAAALDIDVTDDNAIRSHISDAMDIKALVDTDFKAKQFSETVRHNQASEASARIRTVAPGGSVVDVGGGPASAPPPPAGAVPQEGGQLPRGIRNNNPLNVTSLPSGQRWAGQSGDDGQYATFSSPQAGWAAADKNLVSYATKHGLNTVAGVVARWAPEGKDGNDPAAYAATVSKRLGVDANAPLNLGDPTVRRNVLEAMAEIENGQPVAFGRGGGVPSPHAEDGAAPAGAHVLFHAPDKPDEDSPLAPDTTDLLAARYLKDGTLPPMGAGKTATRNRTMILNRASELAKGMGLDANDLVAGTADVKAVAASLTQTTKTISANGGFEETAKKNADLMLKLAPKGAGPTGMPVMNRWIQAGRKQVAGDPDVTAFDNALGAFSEEYAKVMSGALGNSPATDSARAAAHDRLGKYATQGQLQSGVEVMKQEMANRTQSLREVREGLVGRLRGSAGASTNAPPAAPPQVGAIVRGYRFLGGNPADPKSWAKQ